MHYAQRYHPAILLAANCNMLGESQLVANPTEVTPSEYFLLKCSVELVFPLFIYKVPTSPEKGITVGSGEKSKALW